MYTVEDKAKISAILDANNAENLVMELIKEYAEQSVSNSRKLIGQIQSIADTAIDSLYKAAARKQSAVFWSVVGNYTKDLKSPQYFASVVPVVMELFPDGTSENRSNAEKKYFSEFIRMLGDKKVFSLAKKNDYDWAKTYEYLEYLEKAFEKHCIK